MNWTNRWCVKLLHFGSSFSCFPSYQWHVSFKVAMTIWTTLFNKKKSQIWQIPLRTGLWFDIFVPLSQGLGKSQMLESCILTCNWGLPHTDFWNVKKLKSEKKIFVLNSWDLDNLVLSDSCRTWCLERNTIMKETQNMWLWLSSVGGWQGNCYERLESWQSILLWSNIC